MRTAAYVRSRTIIPVLLLTAGLLAATLPAVDAQELPPPRMHAVYQEDHSTVLALDWVEGTDLMLTIDRELVEVYSETGIVDSPDPFGNITQHWFMRETDFRLARGDLVTITGGGITKTHQVTDLTLDYVDLAADTVHGTSPTATEVCVHVFTGQIHPFVCAPVIDGVWVANFSAVLDISATTRLGAFESDEDGDATQVDWIVRIDPIAVEAGDVLISQTDGVLWVYNPDSGSLFDHHLPFGGIWDIQWASNDSIFIANSAGGRIWQLYLESGELELIAEGDPLGFPIGLALDPTDGDALWIADHAAGILRHDLLSGDTQVVVPPFGGQMDGIVADDGGAVYFTNQSGIVYRVASGAPSGYEVVVDVGPYSLNGLVFDAAGSLLATAMGPPAVSEIDVATATSTVYDFSTQMRSSEDTAVGDDGSWWVIDSGFVTNFGDDSGLYRVDVPRTDIIELLRGEPLGDTVDLLIVGPRAIGVGIDITPGSGTNPVNLKSEGVIPVAILTTGDFDAATVDPMSVAFGPAGAREADGRGHLSDVDFDGDIDLMLHFRTQEAGIQPADTEACLTAQTFEGQALGGCDLITVKGGS